VEWGEQMNELLELIKEEIKLREEAWPSYAKDRAWYSQTSVEWKAGYLTALHKMRHQIEDLQV
jgi:hypothetical protein